MYYNGIYFNLTSSSRIEKTFFCLCFLIFPTLKVIKISSEYYKWNYLGKAILLLLLICSFKAFSVFLFGFCVGHDSLDQWSCNEKKFRCCSISRYQPYSLGKWEKNHKDSRKSMRRIQFCFLFEDRAENMEHSDKTRYFNIFRTGTKKTARL
jgi:hypothetical protein